MNISVINSFYCVLFVLACILRFALGTEAITKQSEVNLLCYSAVYGTVLRSLETSSITHCFMVCMTEGICKSCTYNEDSGICKLNSGILSAFTTCVDNVKYAQTYVPGLFECHESGSFKLCSYNLHTGTNEITGYAFVWNGNQWGTVCDDFWELENYGASNAGVMCNSLGYSVGSTVYPLSSTNNITNGIFMDDVRCTGTESNLLQCPYITIHNCVPAENVRVKCVK
ncbi:hypothetical protein ACF0H5_017259 [Mactra antiquata]